MTVTQNLSECFYDFRLVVITSSLCGGTKIDQLTRAVHISDTFIHSFKQNIKFSYCIGLFTCRYKVEDDSFKMETAFSGKTLRCKGDNIRFDKADDRKVNNNKEKVHSIPH